MKITFLGTGAADWPLTKPEGCAEFRRLSSVLIDDVLLIDPGPQVLDALAELQKDRKKIRYIVNTHKHDDHFSPETLSALEADGAVFLPLADGEVTTAGKYTLRAYKGNHSTCENTVHFLISDGARVMFYGLDGAWLLYDEVQAIRKYRPDLAVLDATIGDVDGDYRIFEHNNLSMVLEMKKTLQDCIGKFCISHMARTLLTDHETLSKKMKTYDILAAYDGMETEI